MLQGNTKDVACDTASALSDLFYTSQKKVFKVLLNQSGFTLHRESVEGIKEKTVHINDIVGGRCIRVQKPRRFGANCACGFSSNTGNKKNLGAVDNIEVSAYLYVFSYVLKKNVRNILHRERTVLTLRFHSYDTFEENMREAERWHKVLRLHKNLSISETIGSSRRRLLVLLNPKAGAGKARERFHKQVVPVLNEAELPFDLHVTKHANYAKEFVRTRSLAVWCGIVAVGGDGLLYEILNGLLQRSDWENVLNDIALGIVPCGSGNGLARSIAHLYKEPYDPKPILGAALTIIRGKTTPMDVVRIQVKNQIMFSFLSVGWGLISDIDIESERLRSLGYQRFTIWTLHRLISLRTYRGKISYLIKNDVETCSVELLKPTLKHSKSCNTYLDRPDHNCFQSTEFLGDKDFEDVISLETSVNQSFRSRCDSWLSAGSRKSTYYSITDSIYHSIAADSEYEYDVSAGKTELDRTFGPSELLFNLDDPIPDSWIVEEGEFVMVQAAYQTHLGVDCYFAPSSKLNDGTIYLVIIRSGISRAQLLNFLINMSSGTHLPVGNNNEFVKVVAVTAFRIEPYETCGILTVDGERVPYGTLQGEILPGLAKVMIPK